MMPDLVDRVLPVLHFFEGRGSFLMLGMKFGCQPFFLFKCACTHQRGGISSFLPLKEVCGGFLLNL